MKKIGIIVVFLLIAGGLSAQDYGKFGVGANAGLFMPNKEECTVSFMLNGSIMINENIELRPMLNAGFHGRKANPGIYDADKDLLVGAGVAAYWHILKTDFFRMGPGVCVEFDSSIDIFPKSDVEKWILTGLRLPLMMELAMTKNIVFRAEYSMLLVHFFYEKDSYGDVETTWNVQFLPIDNSRLVENESQVFLGTRILTLGITYRF